MGNGLKCRVALRVLSWKEARLMSKTHWALTIVQVFIQRRDPCFKLIATL